MSEAKLWWDGSQWVTEETTCVYSSSYKSSAWAYVVYKVTIAAHDDATIQMTTSLRSESGYGGSAMSGTKTMKSGDTVIGTGTFTADVTQYSTFSWSGTVKCSVIEWGTTNYHSGETNSASGTINITSPFVTVTYNANGGSDAPAAQNVCTGIASALSESIPTRANHTFLGWATSSSAHVKDYDAGGEITTSADITLYAVWEPAVFISADEGVTVTFDGVSYTNETATVGKTWGAEYPLSVVPNAGFIVKTQSYPNGTVEIDADEITISATSQRVGCHIDDGNDWVQAVIFMDTGEDWQMIQAYVDDGNSWNLVY